MQIHSSPSRCYEFCFPLIDTLVRVETSPDSVVIRASRDSFTDQRKRSFIHELAAEGFIAENYEWLPLAESDYAQGVRWLIDFSWLKIDQSTLGRANRFMARFIVGVTGLWLVQMAVLLRWCFK